MSALSLSLDELRIKDGEEQLFGYRRVDSALLGEAFRHPTIQKQKPCLLEAMRFSEFVK
jgi:hypothetical protein